MTKVRLNKFLAECGIASRRGADDLIIQGKIKVNGRVVKELGAGIDPQKDKVEHLGKTIKPETKLILAFYKPRGVTSTNADKHADKTVADFFPKKLGRLYPVGRLDKDSEGLMIVSNDGNLANKLTHPRYEHEKEYEVIIEGNDPSNVKKFIKRFKLDNYLTLPMQLSKFKKVKSKTWRMNLVLKEGRKRQIRRIADILGYRVVELKRVRIGKLQLKELSSGKFQSIQEKDII
ncbi:rRNA pseudouridine synthase [Patescibacteria group bacterium]|nr:rRNA pseudouridine synthase [Patescibacteria group bacterium]